MRRVSSLFALFVSSALGSIGCSDVDEIADTFASHTTGVDASDNSADSESPEDLSLIDGTIAQKLWFAPPWWLKDHEQGVLGRIPFAELKSRGFDTYKLWIQHISFGKDSFSKGTFGYGCDPKNLTPSNCPLYFGAAKRLTASGLKIAIETPFQNPGRNPTLSAKYGCVIDSNDAAIAYGNQVANAHFNGVHKRWIASGGRIDVIALDGPFDKTLKGGLDADCGFVQPIQSVIFATTYMAKMQTLYQGKIKFVYISNFLNWNYQGIKGWDPRADRKPDLSGFISNLINISKNQRLNLIGIQMDAPLSLVVLANDAARTDKQIRRIQLLAQQTRAAGLRFQAIVNTETGHIAPEMIPLAYNAYRSQIFQKETVYMADMLRGVLKNQLNDVVVQSWHDAPYTLLPGNGSGTHESLLDIARLVSDHLRTPCTVEEYKRRRPDVANDAYFGSRIYYHYQAHGKFERMCAPRITADERFCTPYEYFVRRPDVLASGHEATTHYASSGAREGMCNPNLYDKREIYMGTPYKGRIPFLLDL